MTGLRKHSPAPTDRLVDILRDAGADLVFPFDALATRPTSTGIDDLLARLEGATIGVRQFRRQLAQGQESQSQSRIA